MNNAYVDYLLL